MLIEMNLKTTVIEKRNEIHRLCKKHGAFNIRLFGSTAREEDDSESDLDFIVEMEKGRTLFDLGGLQYELQDLLKIPVDIITEASVSYEKKGIILKEAIAL